ncbi:MAG TPA: tetratricopeptide repeat protein, partial [Blastococcus sp.]
DTLQRCRRILGPDHPITLGSGTALTLALFQLGEAEPARALGEDTVRRCGRVFGADHRLTRMAAAALTSAGGAEVGPRLG